MFEKGNVGVNKAKSSRDVDMSLHRPCGFGLAPAHKYACIVEEIHPHPETLLVEHDSGSIVDHSVRRHSDHDATT